MLLLYSKSQIGLSFNTFLLFLPSLFFPFYFFNVKISPIPNPLSHLLFCRVMSLCDFPVQSLHPLLSPSKPQFFPFYLVSLIPLLSLLPSLHCLCFPAPLPSPVPRQGDVPSKVATCWWLWPAAVGNAVGTQGKQAVCSCAQPGSRARLFSGNY